MLISNFKCQIFYLFTILILNFLYYKTGRVLFDIIIVDGTEDRFIKYPL